MRRETDLNPPAGRAMHPDTIAISSSRRVIEKPGSTLSHGRQCICRLSPFVGGVRIRSAALAPMQSRREGCDARDGPPDDEGMDVMGSLVGVHDLEVDQVPRNRKFV